MGVAPVAPLHHLAPPAPGEASQGVSTHGALHRWRLETWRPVAAGWTIGRVWMVSPCGNKLGVEDVEDVEVMKRMEVWILKRDLALRNGCLNPQESGLSHQKRRWQPGGSPAFRQRVAPEAFPDRLSLPDAEVPYDGRPCRLPTPAVAVCCHVLPPAYLGVADVAGLGLKVWVGFAGDVRSEHVWSLEFESPWKWEWDLFISDLWVIL